MTKLPLGDINEKGAGRYKKNFVDDIESVELVIAHMIPIRFGKPDVSIKEVIAAAKQTFSLISSRGG